MTLEGGLKDNAIPRECTAGLLIPEEKKEELTTYIKELTAELKKGVCGIGCGNND